ncbi:MAG TPA: pyridoxal-phosphate dependent enzyme [Candidatus Dependentiae bacterium]|nr:pyridoxal-phosphate dependent enzyme [Candidatus Dependentiae bacterium]
MVATACYAQALGLKCIAMLKKQPNSQVVRRNLLLMHHFGTEIHLCPDTEFRTLQTIATCIEHKNNHSDFPYFMPTGGSIPVGILGFVNAAFELKRQIEEGVMPEPDYLYVAAGSLGTMVGLLLGLKAAGLKTQLRSVLVEPIENLKASREEITKLFKETNRLLHDADPSFPVWNLTEDEIYLNTDFTGSDYGLFTPEGKQALTTLQETEDIKLDGTYTAKAFAGLLDDASKGLCKNKVILFWNTFCSDDFDDILATQDYKQLSLCFHEFFEKEIQPLDR